MSGPSPSELIQFFGEKVEVAQPFEMEAAEEDEARILSKFDRHFCD